MSYEAIISTATVTPHPDPETHSLAVADVLGYTVIVGLDTLDNSLGIYFPTDGQLSSEYVAANDLLRRKDENGNQVGGLFDTNRKVRSQTIRKVRSEGYFAPLSSLGFTGGDISSLKKGDRLTEFNGVPLCNKFFSRATKAQGEGRAKTLSRHNDWFHKHVDTVQFRFEAEMIKPGSVIYMTEKLHGTSARHAKVWDNQTVVKGRWFWKKTETVQAIATMIGTRNVILGKSEGPGYYGDDEVFRRTVAADHIDNLHVGEIVYGEVVGYLPSGRPVMGEQFTTALKDKKMIKKYGPTLTYAYGSPVGKLAFYVYRIAHVSHDGALIDLPWFQVKARANELGLKVVPDIGPSHFVYDGDVESLKSIVESLIEGSSTLDESHIREGVVLRIEEPTGRIKYLKSKSFTFGVLEGYLKEDENYIDTEESA